MQRYESFSNRARRKCFFIFGCNNLSQLPLSLKKLSSMKKILFFASTLFVLTSCSVYHPQAVDIPLINHPGDTRIDASVSMSYWLVPDVMDANVTLSHGFNDWLTGQIHANFGGDNYYGQVAPGFYLPLGAKSVFETYVGFGYGGGWRDNIDKSNTENASDNYSFSGHYMLPFVQGNIGWHDLTRLHIDLAFGLKLGSFKPDFETFKVDSNGDEIAGSRYTYDKGNLLLEPQFMLRIGGEKMKLSFRAGYSWLSDLSGNSGSSYNFIYDYFTGSVGLTFFL